MKSKHGTRMVQIVTDQWMLQLILDEPPPAMERAWVQRRCKYYAAMEPQDAPRDEAPFLPKETPMSLRLENEASDRMWSLLLETDNMEGINYAEERVKIISSGIAEAQERALPTPIPEVAERIINQPAYENGPRIEKDNILAEHTRP